jgi:hypothetical protein
MRPSPGETNGDAGHARHASGVRCARDRGGPSDAPAAPSRPLVGRRRQEVSQALPGPALAWHDIDTDPRRTRPMRLPRQTTSTRSRSNAPWPATASVTTSSRPPNRSRSSTASPSAADRSGTSLLSSPPPSALSPGVARPWRVKGQPLNPSGRQRASSPLGHSEAGPYAEDRSRDCCRARAVGPSRTTRHRATERKTMILRIDLEPLAGAGSGGYAQLKGHVDDE